MNYSAPSSTCSQCYCCENPHYIQNPTQNTYPPFYDNQKSSFVNGFNPFRDDIISQQPHPMPSFPYNSPPMPSVPYQNDQNMYYERNIKPYSVNPNPDVCLSPFNDEMHDNNTIYTGSNASNSYEQLPLMPPVDTHYMQQPSICPCCPQRPQWSPTQPLPTTFPHQSSNGEVGMLKFSGNGYDHNPFKSAFNTINITKPSINTLREALKKGVEHQEMALRISKMVSSLVSNGSNPKQTLQLLMKENIVNVLKYAVSIHSGYPPIQKECEYALMLLNRLQSQRDIICKSESVKVKRYSKEADGYKCEHCGKVYRYICNLRSHSKIHSDAAHVCEFCNKRFGRKANYIEHRRVHTGETPFECTICNKRFKQRHSWKNHVEKHKIK